MPPVVCLVVSLVIYLHQLDGYWEPNWISIRLFITFCHVFDVFSCFYIPGKNIFWYCRPEDKGKLDVECRKADAIILTYACDRPETLERLSTYWLPELRRLGVRNLIYLSWKTLTYPHEFSFDASNFLLFSQMFFADPLKRANLMCYSCTYMVRQSHYFSITIVIWVLVLFIQPLSLDVIDQGLKAFKEKTLKKTQGIMEFFPWKRFKVQYILLILLSFTQTILLTIRI